MAKESYFYDREPGQAEGSLEYLLSRAETDTAPVISKLLATESIQALSEDDKICVALFLSLQLHRTKFNLNSIQTATTDFTNKIADVVDFYGKESFGNYPEDKEVWRSLFNDMPNYAKIPLKKIWMLAPSNRMFYISYNPVVRQNTINRNPHRGTLVLILMG